MSRETILDDAISKAKEAGDWQLADWLRMARGGQSAARWYTMKLDKLTEENAKLRELVQRMLRNMHGCNYHHSCGSCDFDECVYEANLRELGIEVG